MYIRTVDDPTSQLCQFTWFATIEPLSLFHHPSAVLKLPSIGSASIPSPVMRTPQAPSPFKGSVDRGLVSVPNTIAIAFGLAGTFTALATLVTTIILRNRPSKCSAMVSPQNTMTHTLPGYYRRSPC
jgi:hypothetical protein